MEFSTPGIANGSRRLLSETGVWLLVWISIFLSDAVGIARGTKWRCQTCGSQVKDKAIFG